MYTSATSSPISAYIEASEASSKQVIPRTVLARGRPLVTPHRALNGARAGDERVVHLRKSTWAMVGAAVAHGSHSRQLRSDLQLPSTSVTVRRGEAG